MWREENFAYLSFFIENPTQNQGKKIRSHFGTEFFPQNFPL
jgi:hypothetical protein